MKLVHFPPNDDDDDGHVAAAGELFKSRKIRLHSNYDEFIVALDGPLVAGAAAVSVTGHDETVEFSIAVDPSYERRGVARSLTLAVISLARQYAREYEWERPRVEGYVVNRVAIPPLLRSLGFQPFDDDPRRWNKYL
jgi:N-acetylglutamate synthase-like GNAT family acetyltransferase